jgi:hypothetical protein
VIGTAWPRTAVARWAGGLYLAYVLPNVLASRLGNEPLALLLLVLNAIGVAVQCASYLPLFAVLAQSDSVGLTGPQLDSLAMLSVTTHQTAFVMVGIPPPYPRLAPHA